MIVRSRAKFIFILGIIILVPLLINISLTYRNSTVNDYYEFLHTSRVVQHEQKPWLDNPTFEGSGTPWFSVADGDSSDVNASIILGEANLGIRGDVRTFSEISGVPQFGEWIEVNHSIRPPPLTREINQYGCNVSHVYDEDAGGSYPNSGDQTQTLVGILWKRNITMPVDMSDYIITNASVSAVVNGSADTNIETPPDRQYLYDTYYPAGYASLFDYARFYVEISDLNNIESYEIASNKTLDLGRGNQTRRGSGTSHSMSDTYMTPDDEDEIIFELSQVLKHDNYNFTVTLGIEVDSEDNYQNYELDVWYSLLIKSCNLSFTYVKKMDQSTSISWNQVGNKVTGTNVQITDGNLRFKYKIDQPWPSLLSPNSEIRALINDRQHPETIKLSTATNSFQDAKIGGFDVTSLIPLNDNVTVSIQVFLADKFGLEQPIIVSIDDVYLEISYTETFPNPFSEPWVATGLFIIALLAAAVLSGYLIAYQKYLKYPIPVRKVRKFNKTLNKEKDPDISIIAREKAFSKSFQKEIKKTSKFLKRTPLDGKILKDKLFSKQNK